MAKFTVELQKSWGCEVGGNFRTPLHEAKRIEISARTRKGIADDIGDALTLISVKFYLFFGKTLWQGNSLCLESIASGSSKFLFDESIPDDEFEMYKPSLGDIDVQIDKSLAVDFENFLKGNPTTEAIQLLGWKPSVGQFVTLWYIKSLDQNVQIDFELVDFKDGKPTEWSQFSRSSNWTDVKAGIKGVAHKWLLQSICALDNTPKVILTGKTLKPKETNKSAMTFSVTHGIRDRYAPYYAFNPNQVVWYSSEWGKTNPQWNGRKVYKELTTAQSTFHTKPKDIFKRLFGKEPSIIELTAMKSFWGLCALISKYFTDGQIEQIADDFANRIWGPDAQEIVRWDMEGDFNEKFPAMVWFCKYFSINVEKYQPLASEYYSTASDIKGD